MNREAIWSALWAMTIAAPGITGMFKTTGRWLRHHADVSADQMPALFLLQHSETHQRIGKGIPTKRTLEGSFIFYVDTPNPLDDAVPATLINNALDAIDNLFNTPPNVVQTLGGLVEHAYVSDGRVLIAEGYLQEKSITVVPITILVP